MRTDPPAGDELARLLVTMRTSVMTAALQDAPEPAAARSGWATVRRRVLGIAIALVSLLVIGGGGAALATGLLPNPFDGPPAPPATSAPASLSPETPTATPTPSPEPPPSVEPAEPTVDPFDTGTWIVDYGQAGGLMVGDPIAPFAEAAGLQPNPSPIDCPSGFYRIGSFDENSLDVAMALTQADARITPVDDPVLTYAEFQTRGVAGSPLPDLRQTTSRYDDTMGYTTYVSGPVDGRYLVFQVAPSPDGPRAVRLLQTSTRDVVVDICD